MVWLPLGQHLIDLRLNMLHMHCILHNYAPRFTRLNTLIFVRTQPCVSFFVSLTDPPPPFSLSSPHFSQIPPPLRAEYHLDGACESSGINSIINGISIS